VEDRTGLNGNQPTHVLELPFYNPSQPRYDGEEKTISENRGRPNCTNGKVNPGGEAIVQTGNKCPMTKS